MPGARFLYCTTCDPGTVLIWVRLWQQELRLTFRFAGLHICILLIYLIRFVSKNWKLLSELQLPVVFIDSHHETGEGKEASFCSQFCSYYYFYFSLLCIHFHFHFHTTTFTFQCYVFTFTHFTAALRFESFLERRAHSGASFKNRALGKVWPRLKDYSKHVNESK